MEVIAEKTWDWMLFADGERLLLSVVCGGVGIYVIDFELTDDEAANFSCSGNSYIGQLAHKVRSTPDSFRTRRVSDLYGEEATAAVTKWREKCLPK